MISSFARLNAISCVVLGLSSGVLGAAEPARQMALPDYRLSAAAAAELTAAAVKLCADQGYHVSSVIVDVSGVRQASLRGDGAGIHTLDSAFYKAYTAATFDIDTIELVRQSKTGPVSSSFSSVPNLLLAQGGVVIRSDGKMIAAIGVGGGPGNDIDTKCARGAIEQYRASSK